MFMKYTKEQLSLVGLRLALGWLFLWAFLDKLFGLGFGTLESKSWLAGNSPTAGFLAHGAYGPFAFAFNAMSGSNIVDWLFMVGLLCIGLALLLGIGMKIATVTGSILVLLMWLALLPPKNNPFLDEHIIYFFALLALRYVNSGEYFGLGQWWNSTSLVKRFTWLQ